MPKGKQNKKTTRSRATQAEREDRYRDIDTLMDQGHKPSGIAQAIAHRYGISKRQAERDIRTVKNRRSQYLLLNTPQALRAEHYNRLSYIYRDSMQKGDYQTAMKVVALQDTLIDKVPVTGGKIDESTPTPPTTLPGELEALLAELEKDRLSD